ncbi:MAG: NAD(P)-dependent glycerol-3-phosphate dehydrogenase, partial [Acidobacteriales bacterium]|nr:NAD(P)-dependent glycerol-3-phosphate dehydrogenase [Terriglobales bacterium]
DLRLHRENRRFLPGFTLPDSITPTHDFREALGGADIVLTVMPSHYVRQVSTEMRPHLRDHTPVVSATKGIEERSFCRMSQVLAETLDRNPIGALSGPSFALEVAKGEPTAITFASEDPELAACIQREFSNPAFRVYVTDDLVGVELGGALKNVIAIAAGIVEGLGLGHNTAAALITRGLAEITRLAVACGARRETLAGLAGMGDLVLTCTGGLSRNRSVGVALGHGEKLPDIIAGMHGMVAEGVFTTDAALGLARQHRVEMPIVEQMHSILHEGKAPGDAMRDLMSRPGRIESE